MAKVSAVPLQGYFDDSGNNPKEKYFIWAGLIGPHEGFTELTKRWNEILSSGTNLPWWHTYSAHKCIQRGGGQYGETPIHIDAGELKQKEHDLAQVLCTLGHEGAFRMVSIKINRTEHRVHVVEALKAQPPKNTRLGIGDALRESLSTPELFCLHEIVQAIGAVMAPLEGRAQYAQIFFEDRQGGEDWQDSVCQSVRAFRKLEAPENRTRIGMVTFVPMGISSPVRLPPLEAADMIAWHVRSAGFDDRPVHELWPLIQAIPGGPKCVSPQEMRFYVDRLREGRSPWVLMGKEHLR